MPSTFDPLLRLELQATGENATTWGTKTNNNLDLLAEAISGAVNLNVAGSGDFTLTTANGAEDQARYAILVLTGTLTGNRNIIVPSSPKNYTILNQTSGAFTITVKQAAGTGFAIGSTGPTLTVCTSTTCIDAVGASTFGRSLIVATSAAPARTALELANTATLVATSIGSALITAADTSAGRTAIEAAKSGDVTASGLTMTTSRLLGRTTAATGAVEEITVGSGLSLTGGALTATASAPQPREQLFTAGGTWTAPAGVTQVELVVVGAGGGGGGYDTGDAADGGPGGAGGLAAGIVSVVPSSSYTVTIGTGGTGGAVNVNGTAGGSTSFGSLMSATGGGGGISATGAAGTAGAGTGGTTRNSSINITAVTPFSGPAIRPVGGGTAATAWAINSAFAPGAGGAGSNGSPQTGVGGANGFVYVKWVA